MGNRAVITTKDKTIGIYVHWNGGRDSVEGVLKFMQKHDFMDPEQDSQYALARLCQVYANFFQGSLSIGIGPYNELDTDNGDNGVYIIGEGWKIIGRENMEGRSEQQGHDIDGVVKAIEDRMPKDYPYDS